MYRKRIPYWLILIFLVNLSSTGSLLKQNSPRVCVSSSSSLFLNNNPTLGVQRCWQTRCAGFLTQNHEDWRNKYSNLKHVGLVNPHPRSQFPMILDYCSVPAESLNCLCFLQVSSYRPRDNCNTFFFVRLLFDGVHKTNILILRTYAQYI